MASLVAKSYAQALYEIANEEQKLDEYRQSMNDIQSLFDENTQLMDIIKHPQINKQEKKQLIVDLFGNECDQMMLNFMCLLIDRGRFHLLDEMKEAYDVFYREAKNIKKAMVTSAYPLSEQQREDLINLLQQRTASTIELVEEVDASLIAGMKVQIEDTILDHSAKNALATMKQKMKFVR